MSMEVLSRHWEELRTKKSYLNSTVGNKIKDGKDTGVKAIVIYVKKKQPMAELAEGEVIPSEIEGVPTDVVELAPIGWVADRTAISELHPAEQLHRLGLTPAPKVLTATRRLIWEHRREPVSGAPGLTRLGTKATVAVVQLMATVRSGRLK